MKIYEIGKIENGKKKEIFSQKFEIVKSHRWDGPNDPYIPTKEWLPQSTIKEYNL